MRRLALLALALTAAACGSAGAGVERSVALLPPPDPVVITAPLLPPANGVVLHYADTRCPPIATTVTLPAVAARDCYALQSRLALVTVLLRDRVQPGKASRCYPYVDPALYRNCLDVAARVLPGQAYGLSGQWVRGLRLGETWTGCAAGVAYEDVVFASLAEAARVLPLVAWENGNQYLGYVFDRMDLTDGPLISAATTAAKAACGEMNE